MKHTAAILLFLVLAISISAKAPEQFGQAGDTPVAGCDWDGDGINDITIFRPGANNWYYLRSSDNDFRAYSFGVTGDIPVAGDWNGDGKTDIAVFRPNHANGTGTWYVMGTIIGGQWSMTAFGFGYDTDIPMPGDWDGVGHTQAAVFRPSNGTWYFN